MAAKVTYETHVQPYINLIKQMRIDGCKEEDIASKLKISNSTWYKYKNIHAELNEALKISKEILIADLEETLFQQAKKGNTTALIFALKNLAPHKWGEKIDVNAQIESSKFLEAIERFTNKI